MQKLKILGLCLALAGSVTTVQANQLNTIKEKGVLVCGTLGIAQPFSFQDTTTRQVVGYDVDFCKLIADKLGVKVTYKLLSVAARIPELQEGRVDILAANLGYTPERAEQIAFSYMYYIAPKKFLVRYDSDIHKLSDLEGKRVGAVKGSSSERELKRLLPNSVVIGYPDGSANYLALQQKKVAAQFANEMVLIPMVLQSPPSSRVRLLEESFIEEPWGMGMRKNEPEFIAAVNNILNNAEKSGKAQEIFTKWFGPDTPFKLTRSFKIQPMPQAQ